MRKSLFDNERRYTLKLTSDYVFHYIYGRDVDESKTALISLLNTILEKTIDPIKAVTIKNPINYREFFTAKEATMDIKAETDKGYLVDIEMQTSHYGDFVKRSVFNAAQMANASLHKGNKYDSMRLSIEICIIEDKVLSGDMNLLSRHCFMEMDKHTVLSDVTQIHFLELGRVDINKPVEELSKLEKLAFYLKYACDRNQEEKILQILEETEELAMTEDIFDKMLWDDEEYDRARRRFLYQADRISEMDYATGQGLKKGLEQGKTEIALNMKNKGFDVETITELTGLSVEEIDKL